MPGTSVLQRSDAGKGGARGNNSVAINMDHLDAQPRVNDMNHQMSQMELVDEQVREKLSKKGVLQCS